MKYNKILIPTMEEWNGCQLTIGNLDNFKNFLGCRAYNIQITTQEMKDKTVPIKICFKWNPYGDDYGESVDVSLGQWFLYNIEELRDFKVLEPEEIEVDWYSYEIEN